jgi:hypothetical protein
MFVENEIQNLKFYDMFGGSTRINSNDIIFKFVCVRKFSLLNNVDGSMAIIDELTTSPFVVSLQKNGYQFATITFNSNSQAGVFEGIPVSFEIGDILSVVAPVLYESTNSGIWFTISGVL